MIRSIVILSLLVGCGGVEVSTTEEPVTEVTTTTEVTPGTTSATDVTVTTGTDSVTTTPATPVTTGTGVTTTPATTQEPGAVTPTTTTPTTVETSGSLGTQDLQSPVVASVDNCIQDYNVVECQSTDTDVVATPAVETATELVVVSSDTDVADTDVADSDVTATLDSPSAEDAEADSSEESFFTPTELGFLSAGVVFLVGLIFVLRRRSA